MITFSRTAIRAGRIQETWGGRLTLMHAITVMEFPIIQQSIRAWACIICSVLRCAAILSAGLAGVVARAEGAGTAWLSANDSQIITRTGDWQWTSHRYAAESALATVQDGAVIWSSPRRRACTTTSTPVSSA